MDKLIKVFQRLNPSVIHYVGPDDANIQQIKRMYQVKSLPTDNTEIGKSSLIFLVADDIDPLQYTLSYPNTRFVVMTPKYFGFDNFLRSVNTKFMDILTDHRAPDHYITVFETN